MFDITYDPRVSGEIRRYHTWSVLRDQSVGEHTWQIMRILLTVWPRCPRRVLVYAVGHDMGEMGGDIAYPFKSLFPELKSLTSQVESYVATKQAETCGRPEIPTISSYEQTVFKLCEYVEMWEYGLHEMNMGNRYATTIVDRMMIEIRNALVKLEEFSDTQFAREHPGIPQAIRRYMQQRINMENTCDQ
jgi:hypothetical protein